MKKIRIGFLIDSETINYYIYDLIQFVLNNDLFYEPIVITGHGMSSTKQHYIKAFFNFRRHIYRFLYLVISRFEGFVSAKRFPQSRLNYKLATLDGLRFIYVQGIWSKSNLNLSFTDKDIKALDIENFDLIIRCGNGILQGEILDLAKFGVLSFHHGDNRVNRGGPAGFWEVFYSEPSSGFVIQKLSKELDGGQVVFRGNIPTESLWILNREKLKQKSNIFMKQILVQIAYNRDLSPLENPYFHDRILYKLNGNPMLLTKYLFKVWPQVLSNSVIRLFRGKRINVWSISYSKDSMPGTSLWRYRDVPNPKNSYLADPFVITHGKRTVIFVEQFIIGEKKGVIAAVDVSSPKELFLGPVLIEPFHLSFPFVFEVESNLYMIPETAEIKEIRLYKCCEFPGKWQYHKTLIKEIDAADTMVFNDSGMWFMLPNVCSANQGDHDSELHIFYTPDMFKYDWIPINSGNPVIFDSQKARNGGFFYFDSTLYRVNQIHSGSTYGKSFAINRVEKLTPDGYKEVQIQTVGPYFKKNGLNTHHYNSNLEVSVIDSVNKVIYNK